MVQNVENPYYGGDPDVGPASTMIQTVENPYYGGEPEIDLTRAETRNAMRAQPGNFDNAQVTENPYYE